MKIIKTLLLLGCVIFLNQLHAQNTPEFRFDHKIHKWDIFEMAFKSPKNQVDPINNIHVKAVFTGPEDNVVTICGFWDGDDIFRIRFSPISEGIWKYRIISNDKDINGITGEFRCIHPRKKNHGFLRRDANHPYHFIWDDGTRYFMLGQTYYDLVKCTPDEWEKSISGTAKRGMNKIRFNAWVDPKDLTANLENFKKLDQLVETMARHEIVADIIIFGVNKDRKIYDVTQQEALDCARYILSRYAAYTNVIWDLVNEWNYRPYPREYWNEIGKIIRIEDPYIQEANNYRLLSIHQQTRIDFQFFDQNWPVHAIVQYGVRNRGVTDRDEWSSIPYTTRFPYGDDWGNATIVYNLGHNMPVVNDEYGYIGEAQDESDPNYTRTTPVTMTREKHRRILWGTYVAGGYGAAGDKYDYGEGVGRPYFTGRWKDPEEYRDIQILHRFFTTKGIEYWKMYMHNEFVKKGERVYVYAEPGRQYVIYAASGGDFSVFLEEGIYMARLFNPATGKDNKIGKVKGGLQNFSTPDQNDWVVYLQKLSH